MKAVVETPNAAPPAGHYTPAIRAGDFVFLSGQGPVDAGTGQLVLGTVAEQTALTLRNLATLAEAAGGSLADAVKVNAYLADIADFQEYNTVYKETVPSPPPARTTVATGLAGGMLVEIDAILYLPAGDG